MFPLVSFCLVPPSFLSSLPPYGTNLRRSLPLLSCSLSAQLTSMLCTPFFFFTSFVCLSSKYLSRVPHEAWSILSVDSVGTLRPVEVPSTSSRMKALSGRVQSRHPCRRSPRRAHADDLGRRRRRHGAQPRVLPPEHPEESLQHDLHRGCLPIPPRGEGGLSRHSRVLLLRVCGPAVKGGTGPATRAANLGAL